MADATNIDRSKLQTLLILLCASVPSFMINLDANIVSISLPSIARSLNANFASIEWVISAYTLTFASLVLPAGALADLHGRKRMLIIGLALFTLASLVCGAAPNALVLNGARALQGVGAALQLSAALATLSHEFRGAERAKAFAFWGSVIGLAITLGPVLGGLITQKLGWRWAFYINLPVGVAMIGLVIYALQESKDPAAKGIDISGSITFTAMLFMLTLALISGNHLGWTSAAVLGELATAAALFAVFIGAELVQKRPMLDLGFFRRPTYIGANIAGLTYAASALTMLTYLPLYFQGGLSLSPQVAGLLMVPMAVPLFIVPRLVGKYLTHRVSGRVLLSSGLVGVALGWYWVAQNIGHFSYLDVLPGMLLAGCAAGVLNGETAKVAMSAIPPERAGMAAGVGGTIRFSGIVTGFAALGAILFATVSERVAQLAEGLSVTAQATIIQHVTAGDLGGLANTNPAWVPLARESLAAGYSTIFFVTSGLAAISALAVWFLVRSADTAPTFKDLADDLALPIPEE